MVHSYSQCCCITFNVVIIGYNPRVSIALLLLMQTTENIDYKKLYEQGQLKIAALNHELANLKKLIFGSRQERFIPERVAGQAVQGSLGLHADVVEACKITVDTKVTHQASKAEVITQRKDHPGRMKLLGAPSPRSNPSWSQEKM